MNGEIKKTRVNLDRRHALDIYVSESDRTVIAELITDDEPADFIYAEKFDTPCNYIRTAIKKSFAYIDESRGIPKYEKTENFTSLNA